MESTALASIPIAFALLLFCALGASLVYAEQDCPSITGSCSQAYNYLDYTECQAHYQCLADATVTYYDCLISNTQESKNSCIAHPPCDASGFDPFLTGDNSYAARKTRMVAEYQKQKESLCKSLKHACSESTPCTEWSDCSQGIQTCVAGCTGSQVCIANEQPGTQPVTQNETQPETQPVTQNGIQPVTQPETQPETATQTQTTSSPGWWESFWSGLSDLFGPAAPPAAAGMTPSGVPVYTISYPNAYKQLSDVISGPANDVNGVKIYGDKDTLGDISMNVAQRQAAMNFLNSPQCLNPQQCQEMARYLQRIVPPQNPNNPFSLRCERTFIIWHYRCY